MTEEREHYYIEPEVHAFVARVQKVSLKLQARRTKKLKYIFEMESDDDGALRLFEQLSQEKGSITQFWIRASKVQT